MGKWVPMEKIRNLSLRKTIVLYMTVAIIITFFLSAVVVKMAEGTQRQIWAEYTDWDKHLDFEEETGNITEITRPAQDVYKRQPQHSVITRLFDGLHYA